MDLRCSPFRVNSPVTEHLNAQGRLDPMGGLRCSIVQTKLEPHLLAHLVH
jgi:hypothetical protein